MIVASVEASPRSLGQSLRSRHASPAALSINNRSPPTALPSETGAHQCTDRCLICLSRPDDYEDVARGMTCGMCSACGTARRPLDAVNASPRNRRRDRHSCVDVYTGTFFCGECKPQLARRACAADADRALRERGWGACPACRAPLRASHSENVKRLERLLITRTEGKHVARVQYKLGLAYELGRTNVPHAVH